MDQELQEGITNSVWVPAVRLFTETSVWLEKHRSEIFQTHLQSLLLNGSRDFPSPRHHPTQF